MKTFLIQGDSITDADRNRSDDTKRGNGYANIVASEIMCDYPGQFNIINRGKKGDRSVDLYARIKSDIINSELFKHFTDFSRNTAVKLCFLAVGDCADYIVFCTGNAGK